MRDNNRSRNDAILSKDPRWQEGFEAGIAFLLMIQGCPELQGVYSSLGDEQLLLFASQLGYDVQWARRADGKTWMRFKNKFQEEKVKELEGDEEDY